MQCPNCQFHNMPGTKACGRCGTSLNLAGDAIDVHPPRAGAMALRLRRAFPLSRSWYAARDRWENGARRHLSRFADAAPEAESLFRTLVPGWAHLFLGRRRTGLVLMWSWLFFLLTGLVFFGTMMGSILLGIAFSIHSFAASDVLNRSSDGTVGTQIRRSIFVSIALAALIYAPAAYLLTRVLDPVTPRFGKGVISDNDTLLVNHWATPVRGSVVMYDIPEYRGTPRGDGHKLVAGYAGQRIDRILAVEKDVVEIRKGVLLVNGKIADNAPLNWVRTVDISPLTIPEGRVFILPSTGPDLGFAATEGNLLLAMSIVPVNNLSGVVYARIRPVSTFRLIY